MCGIVAVLSRPSTRPAPDLVTILASVQEATGQLGREVASLVAAAERLESVNRQLRGTPGLACLLGTPGAIDQLASAIAPADAWVASLDRDLDAGLLSLADAASAEGHEQTPESLNAALVRLKDVLWAIERDRLGMARAVNELAPPGFDGRVAGWDSLWAIQVALAAIDRLEVRGRDSAGLGVLVCGHGLDVDAADMARRSEDPLFTSRSVRVSDGCLSFVYKAAAEIGELGDNVAALRAAIRADALLGAALASPDATCTVLAHTRWASVGLISEANAHPLNSDELDRGGTPYVTGVLNGDIDNHAELRLSENVRLPAELTTDAKLIPTLVSRRLAGGHDVDEAFRSTVTRFDGSVAIGVSSAVRPDQIHLALKGSGQSLYIGLAEDAFVVASEPYGVVEETDCYIRMDGEATQGQTARLDRSGAGTLEGIVLARYDGAPIAVDQHNVVTAEITTRDIDRRGFPHFLLKEISESPRSFQKTLRGHIVSGDGGRANVRLGDDVLARDLREGLASGAVRKVLVVGQGTAAVAGQAVAAAVGRLLPACTVLALPATELSGFGLTDDMSDTLVVAVSQSGTTTDTNRTVDLVRARGAYTVGIVNRRNSDLVAKVGGVLYTSDGRDVEMSVASTKAFYAQVAAGWLLAIGLADAAGAADAGTTDRLVGALRLLPAAMEAVVAEREGIARVASRLAPPRRYWAVVGSGPDRVAAQEIRIKLSELCYKAIACDATEDKKHIDLSSEPLILVCAAGLSGPNAADVAKEVTIYRAHKAAPVVIAAHGEAARFRDALEVIEVPAVEPELAFVLSAMAGHLFGYEAALSIDGQSRPLREARVAIEAEAAETGGRIVLDRVAPTLTRVTQPFLHGVRDGSYNGHLEAATAIRVVSLLRYATGTLPVEAYELESGKVGAPSTLITDLLDALGAAIDELTRPVDAIKHQAKTVTVGISRSEDALLGVRLVASTLAAGATPDLLGYRALRTLAALDPAVEEVLGYTRYRIEGEGSVVPTIAVVDQGGVGRQLRSRTTSDPRLRGSKHRAVDERETTVVRGASDGRTVVLVPEVKGAHVTGMTLLHVRFVDFLDPADAAAVLAGYRGRLSALSDAVTETEPHFDQARLGEVPIVDLLTDPVYVLAERWRANQ